MKTIVYSRDFEELEIRPQSTIEEYLRLTAEEVRPLLIQPEPLLDRACPGCGSNANDLAFEKYGLKYRECKACSSVFVSPCPSDALIVRFYRESAAAHYWREFLAKQTSETRRGKVYAPLADWIVEVVDRYKPGARKAIDIGYHSNLLLEELSARTVFTDVLAANPIADIECGHLDLPEVTVRPLHLREVAARSAEVVISFDILNRIADVDCLLDSASLMLSSGGLLLLNAMSISGFDLQVLWQHSPNIHPPDRINLLSSEGLIRVAERHGFQVLEFSTPGMFDVDNVRRALAKDPHIECTRFERYLVTHRDEASLQDFQECLQRNRLSSFARLALRKA